MTGLLCSMWQGDTKLTILVYIYGVYKVQFAFTQIISDWFLDRARWNIENYLYKQ